VRETFEQEHTMERRRHRSRTIPGPVGAVLLAGILVAGPLTAPAAAWSESVNPTPSPTTGYINFHSEGAEWFVSGGPLKISPFVPPRPPKGSPVLAGVIGQKVTVRTNLWMKKPGQVKKRLLSRRTQEVRLLAHRPTITVDPGTFDYEEVGYDHDASFSISYVVTWRWLTSPNAKPLPEPLRTVWVNPTEESDATCIEFDLGTCTVDDHGWIKFGTTFDD
jgi:hypothetical protein